ncbi:MAG: hypothetical protein MI810_21420 [Flavobacteriales bacterium]|nr:hypothetical protein [Flavobacteriales bacterium]
MKPLKNYLTLFFALTLFGLTSCGNSKKATDAKNEGVPKAIVVEDMEPYQKSASVTINSVLLKGDLLTLSVQYSGGCEEHEFKLVGSKHVEKTMPVKRGVKLYHDNKGDGCRELVEDILVFDIKDLGIAKQEVVLMIDGYDHPISYKLLK